MKNYCCSWSISYDVNILICYFQFQRVNHATFKFLILRGAGFETHRIFRTSHIINKMLLGLPSLRLSELSSSFKLMIIFVIFSNLLVLSTSSRESICDFNSNPISEFSSLSIYTLLFNTTFLPILSNTSIVPCNQY